MLGKSEVSATVLLKIENFLRKLLISINSIERFMVIQESIRS